ncbi:hypothetical protein KQH81_00950 [Clostridium cadaveris]|uniref:hypothetical protein n=1 Tax=Clostridium cadaveris TaxID=1529 RepID=UPI001E346D41|nr:hypothetical protein [Clostridium cadaveris]UFH65165.1 hypothetical protein KQH81_00950 [Clostridium cadaveris]
MTHDRQKNIRILDELTSYCYLKGAEHISINLDVDNDLITFTLKCYVPNITKNDIDYLETSLNVPRCHEMEEYYWELTGDTEGENELSLVGMMIDSVDIILEEDILVIEVKRKNN